MSNSILKFLKYSNFDIKKAIIYKRAYDMILEQDLFDNPDDIILEDYPNVKKSGMNPLVHYVLYGKDEGKKIFSLPDKEKIRILEKNKEFLQSVHLEKDSVDSTLFKTVSSCLNYKYANQ